MEKRNLKYSRRVITVLLLLLWHNARIVRKLLKFIVITI